MVVTAAEVVVEVSGKKTNLDALLRNTEQQLEQTTTAAGRAARTIEGVLAQAEQKAEISTLAHARALATIKARFGDTTGAANTLVAALEREDRSSKAAISATGQLATYQQKLTRDTENLTRVKLGAMNATGQFSARLGALQDALGSLGIALGAQAIIQYGVAAGQAALALDRVQKTTRAIAGDQETYNRILGVARDQQSLFGGTLQENLEDLSGFSVQARLTGANLEELIGTAQRLATFDPGQGIRGASLALREALSGNPASLAARFELPRAAIAGLRDESATAADRLKIINDVLADAGITSDTVRGSVSETARTYNDLGAAADNAKTALGGLLAEAAKPIADGGAQALQFIADGLNQIVTASDQAKGVATQVFADTTSYDAYLAKIAQVNSELIKIGITITPISQAQYGYAKSLTDTGVSAADAEAKVRTLGVAVQAGVQANTAWGAGSAGLADQMVALSGVSDSYRLTIEQLSIAYLNGAIGGDELRAGIAQLESAQLRASEATALQAFQQEELALKTNSAQAAIEQAAAQSVIDAQVKEEQALRTQILEQTTLDAANAFIALNPNMSASAAAAAAGAAGLDPMIVKLIELILKTQQARSELAALGIAQAKGGAAGVGFKGIDARGAPRAVGAAAKANEVATASTKRRQDAEISLAAAQGNTARQVSLLQQQQAKLNTTDAEWIQLQSRIVSLQNKGGGAGRGGGAGGGVDPRVKQSEGTQLKLTEVDIKEEQKREDLLAEHADRMLTIEADFYKQREDAQKAFGTRFADTNASFYDTLVNMQDQGVARQFDAQFQQVLAQLPQIAAEKGADVADAYLAAQEGALKAQASRAAEIAKAEADGDAGRAEALRGVDALYRASEQRKVDAALSGIDSIAAKQQQARNEEGARLEEGLTKIETASDRSTDKINRSSDLRIAQLNREAEAAGKTATAYDRVGGAGTKPSGTTTAGATGGATPTPGATTGASAAQDTTLADLKASLDRLGAAITAKLDEVVSAEGQTTSALRERNGLS